jgi:uncharacterized protein YhbP (UPF0306 family)
VTDEVKQKALAYLRGHQVMTLATSGDRGVWAAAVFYVNRDFDFYFLSAGHTRHAQNMEVHQRVAATIQEDYTDWPRIQGVQLEGIVRQLDETDLRQVKNWYLDKFPFLASDQPQIERALRQVNWYELKADLCYFIDNSRGLGHRDEIPIVAV